MTRYDFTISSTDVNNRVIVNLSSAETEYCKLTVTNLTTSANIVVLKAGDYIAFDTFTLTYNGEDLSSLGDGLFVSTMNDYMGENASITFKQDACGRVYITSDHAFSLLDCSYNYKILLGIYSEPLPMHAKREHAEGETAASAAASAAAEAEGETFALRFKNVGCYLSTPVLYLASNVGTTFYKNLDKAFTSLRILMRINNSFFVAQPVIACNGDFTTTLKSSDLSDVRFTLIDANFHEVELLSPMYLTIEVESIPDNNVNEHDFSQGAIDVRSIIPFEQTTDYDAYQQRIAALGTSCAALERGREYSTAETTALFGVSDSVSEE